MHNVLFFTKTIFLSRFFCVQQPLTAYDWGKDLFLGKITCRTNGDKIGIFKAKMKLVCRVRKVVALFGPNERF